ncbi:MAG TPA: flavodoxin domain-containing protein [Jiangellaceae bacterium]
MRALVVYESMFGNTRAVAHAVAKGLERWIPADVMEVGAAPTDLGEDIALLIVGGPTHAFGMSRDSTRRDAAKQGNGSVVSSGEGIREWLSKVVHMRDELPAAAFDTKINKSWLPGSAAKAAYKRLNWQRFRLVTAPESFLVTDVTGPLVDGELDRAEAWGEQVGVVWARGSRAAGPRP